MLNSNPLLLSRRWTSAIWADTLAVEVPIGMRQKSAMHFGGVLKATTVDVGPVVAATARVLTGGVDIVDGRGGGTLHRQGFLMQSFFEVSSTGWDDGCGAVLAG